MTLFGWSVPNGVLSGDRMMTVKDALLRVKNLRLYASETVLAICPNFKIEQFTSELAVPTHSAVVQPLRPSRLTTSPTSPARVNQDLATHFAKETNPDFSGDVSPFDGYDYVTCDASQSHTHAHPSSTRQQELSKRAAYIRNHAPGASHKAKLCDPICVRGLPCDTPSCSLQPALALHRDPYNVSPQSSSHSQTTTTVAPPHQTHGIQSSAFSDIDQRFAAQPKSPSMSSPIDGVCAPHLAAAASLCPACLGGAVGYVMSDDAQETEADSGVSQCLRKCSPLGDCCPSGHEFLTRSGLVRSLLHTPKSNSPPIVCQLCRCLRDCIILTCTRLIAIKDSAVVSDLWIHGANEAAAVPIVSPGCPNDTTLPCPEDSPASVTGASLLIVRGLLRWRWDVIASTSDDAPASSAVSAAERATDLNGVWRHTKQPVSGLVMPTDKTVSDLLINSPMLRFPADTLGANTCSRVWNIRLIRSCAARFLPHAIEMLSFARAQRLSLPATNSPCPTCAEECAERGRSGSISRECGISGNHNPFEASLSNAARLLEVADDAPIERANAGYSHANVAVPVAASTPATVSGADRGKQPFDSSSALQLKPQVLFESMVSLKLEQMKLVQKTTFSREPNPSCSAPVRDTARTGISGTECWRVDVNRTKESLDNAISEKIPEEYSLVPESNLFNLSGRASNVCGVLTQQRLLFFSEQPTTRLADVPVYREGKTANSLAVSSTQHKNATISITPRISGRMNNVNIPSARFSRKRPNVYLNRITSSSKSEPSSPHTGLIPYPSLSPPSTSSHAFPSLNPTQPASIHAVTPHSPVNPSSLPMRGAVNKLHTASKASAAPRLPSMPVEAMFHHMRSSQLLKPAFPSRSAQSALNPSLASDENTEYPLKQSGNAGIKPPSLACTIALPLSPTMMKQQWQPTYCGQCGGVRLSLPSQTQSPVALLMSTNSLPKAATNDRPNALISSQTTASTTSCGANPLQMRTNSRSAWRGVCACLYNMIPVPSSSGLCLVLPAAYSTVSCANDAGETANRGEKGVNSQAVDKESVHVLHMSLPTRSLRDAWITALYDVICEPQLPLNRANVGSLAGHGAWSAACHDIVRQARFADISNPHAVAKSSNLRPTDPSRSYVPLTHGSPSKDGASVIHENARADASQAPHFYPEAGLTQGWALPREHLHRLSELLRSHWQDSALTMPRIGVGHATDGSVQQGAPHALSMRVTAALPVDRGAFVSYLRFGMHDMKKLLSCVDSLLPGCPNNPSSPLSMLSTVTTLALTLDAHNHHRDSFSAPSQTSRDCSSQYSPKGILYPYPRPRTLKNKSLTDEASSPVCWVIDGHTWQRAQLWHLVSRLLQGNDTQRKNTCENVEVPTLAESSRTPALEEAIDISSQAVPHDQVGAFVDLRVSLLESEPSGIPSGDCDRDVVAVSVAILSGSQSEETRVNVSQPAVFTLRQSIAPTSPFYKGWSPQAQPTAPERSHFSPTSRLESMELATRPQNGQDCCHTDDALNLTKREARTHVIPAHHVADALQRKCTNDFSSSCLSPSLSPGFLKYPSLPRLRSLSEDGQMTAISRAPVSQHHLRLLKPVVMSVSHPEKVKIPETQPCSEILSQTTNQVMTSNRAAVELSPNPHLAAVSTVNPTLMWLRSPEDLFIPELSILQLSLAGCTDLIVLRDALAVAVADFRKDMVGSPLHLCEQLLQKGKQALRDVESDLLPLVRVKMAQLALFSGRAKHQHEKERFPSEECQRQLHPELRQLAEEHNPRLFRYHSRCNDELWLAMHVVHDHFVKIAHLSLNSARASMQACYLSRLSTEDNRSRIERGFLQQGMAIDRFCDAALSLSTQERTQDHPVHQSSPPIDAETIDVATPRAIRRREDHVGYILVNVAITFNPNAIDSDVVQVVIFTAMSATDISPSLSSASDVDDPLLLSHTEPLASTASGKPRAEALIASFLALQRVGGLRGLALALTQQDAVHNALASTQQASIAQDAILASCSSALADVHLARASAPDCCSLVDTCSLCVQELPAALSTTHVGSEEDVAATVSLSANSCNANLEEGRCASSSSNSGSSDARGCGGTDADDASNENRTETLACSASYPLKHRTCDDIAQIWDLILSQEQDTCESLSSKVAIEGCQRVGSWRDAIEISRFLESLGLDEDIARSAGHDDQPVLTASVPERLLHLAIAPDALESEKLAPSATDVLKRLTGRIQHAPLFSSIFITPPSDANPEQLPHSFCSIPAESSLGLGIPECDIPLIKLAVRDASSLIRDDYVRGQDAYKRSSCNNGDHTIGKIERTGEKDPVMLLVPELLLTPTATLDNPNSINDRGGDHPTKQKKDKKKADCASSHNATSNGEGSGSGTGSDGSARVRPGSAAKDAGQQRDVLSKSKSVALADRFMMATWAR